MKLQACAVLLVTALVASAAERSDIYPFDVKIGGQVATVAGKGAIFAKIKDPVAADAELEVMGTAGLLIVNAFPVTAKGDPDESRGAMKVLMNQSGNKVKLSETMDQTKLTPGLWGANIVFGNGTARVMFTVK